MTVKKKKAVPKRSPRNILRNEIIKLTRERDDLRLRNESSSRVFLQCYKKLGIEESEVITVLPEEIGSLKRSLKKQDERIAELTKANEKAASDLEKTTKGATRILRLLRGVAGIVGLDIDNHRHVDLVEPYVKALGDLDRAWNGYASSSLTGLLARGNIDAATAVQRASDIADAMLAERNKRAVASNEPETSEEQTALKTLAAVNVDGKIEVNGVKAV